MVVLTSAAVPSIVSSSYLISMRRPPIMEVIRFRYACSSRRPKRRVNSSRSAGERRPRVPPTLIRDDGQIEVGHPGELDMVVLDFSNRARATEIPLLAEDFPE